VALPGDGELFQRARDAGFQTEQIDCGPYRSGSKSASDAARFIMDTVRLAGRVQQLARGMDLIYVNGPRVLPGAALASMPARMVFHAHSLLPDGAIRAIAGAAVRRSRAHVIAACEFVAAPWRAFAGTGDVHVIYNGVTGPVSSLWHAGGLRVGCIGRISREKGQLEFVQAARSILRELPAARFVIHGAALFGDPEAERYEAQVRQAAANLPVEFPGWTLEIYRHWPGSTCCWCLPPRTRPPHE
jgi:glycosyltransferase involved in cell wall biosynthesis